MKYPNKKKLINKTTKYLHAFIYIYDIWSIKRQKINQFLFCLCLIQKYSTYYFYFYFYIIYTLAFFSGENTTSPYRAMKYRFFGWSIYSPRLYIFPIILKRVLYFSFPFFFCLHLYYHIYFLRYIDNRRRELREFFHIYNNYIYKRSFFCDYIGKLLSVYIYKYSKRASESYSVFEGAPEFRSTSLRASPTIMILVY